MKKKLLFSALSFLIIGLSSCNVLPSNNINSIVTEGLHFEKTVENGINGVKVIYYDGTSNNVIIRSQYGDYPVFSIGNDAFNGCFYIKEITIPTSVVYIDSRAFIGCESLSTVYYTGTEEQWRTINIDWSGNADLINANIVYNYK